jgi:hypothetical protein
VASSTIENGLKLTAQFSAIAVVTASKLKKIKVSRAQTYHTYSELLGANFLTAATISRTSVGACKTDFANTLV